MRTSLSTLLYFTLITFLPNYSIANEHVLEIAAENLESITEITTIAVDLPVDEQLPELHQTNIEVTDIPVIEE